MVDTGAVLLKVRHSFVVVVEEFDGPLLLLGLSSKFGIGGLGIGQLLLELGNDVLIGRIGSALDVVGIVVADFVLVVIVFNVGGSIIVGAGCVTFVLVARFVVLLRIVVVPLAIIDDSRPKASRRGIVVTAVENICRIIVVVWHIIDGWLGERRR